MFFVLPTNERKGKAIVKRRTKAKVDEVKEFGYSIDQAFDYFISLKKTEGVREATMNDYFKLMKYFREWLSEQYPDLAKVEEITTQILREYIIYLSEERYNEATDDYGLSPYTVNVRIRFLKAFFNGLHNEKILENNPVGTIQLMRVDEDTFEPLTDEEIEKILAVPDEGEYAQFRDLVMMFLMLDTGMRIKEVCSLELDDIDFKSRAIILPANKNKNRKPRILPLSNQVVKLLMELVSENKTYFDTTFVFLSNCGTRYNPNSFRQRLRIYRNKSGIKKKVSPHVFRHMFCRNFILNGGDVFTLQRIVGHADITTTRKYIQMDDTSIKNQHSLYSPVLRIRKKFN